MEVFQNRLKEIRLSNGFSQKTLATLLDTTNSSVCDWERGRTFPDESTLVKLAGILNVSIDYLLGRTDEIGAVVMPGSVQLTDEERKILEQYHALRPDLKEIFWITLNALGGSSAPASAKKKA